ncbi:hypothetical protein NDU88_000947 [Pleurodeles waltl]|uniref:Uncharacterized protein n=1 Tax=Pleurodeles waltl TaxID=8319 RepID=A0AAV7VW56_PLEWA|nr:hypothetical protein NDU88_000947 [Pleurodeles waltl]
MEKAWQLVSHLNTSKEGQEYQGRALWRASSDRVKEANSPMLACVATLVPAVAAQQLAKTSAGANTSVASSSIQTTADSGICHLSPLLDLGDIRSEHEHLGLNVPMEVKEKIWKGAYIDIFDLLVDRSEKDEVKRRRECAHSRECGYWPHKRKVEASHNNWARAFSADQAIIAERFNDQGAQLACYQNRIVSAHDEYGDTSWKDYDKEIRRIKANMPSPCWD